MSEHVVLVVEDDFFQKRQMVRVLAEEGYEVVEASDGLEAIRVLSDRKIHLVVTDLRMPCLDGISLLKYIKIFFPLIPIVVATGYPQELEELRPDALLCKPFRSDELMAWVRRLLQRAPL